MIDDKLRKLLDADGPAPTPLPGDWHSTFRRPIIRPAGRRLKAELQSKKNRHGLGRYVLKMA